MIDGAAALAGGLTLGAAALTVVSGLLEKKPQNIVNPMAWQSDPQAGIPHVIGRCYFGGQITYRQAYDTNDTNEGRALNRRTRIVILPQLDQFFKLLEHK